MDRIVITALVRTAQWREAATGFWPVHIYRESDSIRANRPKCNIIYPASKPSFFLSDLLVPAEFASEQTKNGWSYTCSLHLRHCSTNNNAINISRCCVACVQECVAFFLPFSNPSTLPSTSFLWSFAIPSVFAVVKSLLPRAEVCLCA